MPMDLVIERIWIMADDSIWISCTWRIAYVPHIPLLLLMNSSQKPIRSFISRISRIHLWYHWHRQHMAAMMLAFLLADHGRIYSLAFMNRISYRMRWHMQRALAKVCRRVSKTRHLTTLNELSFHHGFIRSIYSRIALYGIQHRRFNWVYTAKRDIGVRCNSESNQIFYWWPICLIHIAYSISQNISTSSYSQAHSLSY